MSKELVEQVRDTEDDDIEEKPEAQEPQRVQFTNAEPITDENHQQLHFNYLNNQSQHKLSPAKLSKYLSMEKQKTQLLPDQIKVDQLQAIRKKMQMEFDQNLDSKFEKQQQPTPSSISENMNAEQMQSLKMHTM